MRQPQQAKACCCRCCEATLSSWLPVHQAAYRAMLFGHRSPYHPLEVGHVLAPMATPAFKPTEDSGRRRRRANPQGPAGLVGAVSHEPSRHDSHLDVIRTGYYHRVVERRVRVVRRLVRSSAWLCMGLLVTACTLLQVQDFPHAVDHPSQAEVVERLGLPESIVAGAEGQTLWIYTARSPIWVQPGGIVVTSSGWVVPGGWPCTQYLLRFDRMQVLRGWTARRC